MGRHKRSQGVSLECPAALFLLLAADPAQTCINMHVHISALHSGLSHPETTQPERFLHGGQTRRMPRGVRPPLWLLCCWCSLMGQAPPCPTQVALLQSGVRPTSSHASSHDTRSWWSEQDTFIVAAPDTNTPHTHTTCIYYLSNVY